MSRKKIDVLEPTSCSAPGENHKQTIVNNGGKRERHSRPFREQQNCRPSHLYILPQSKQIFKGGRGRAGAGRWWAPGGGGGGRQQEP